MLECLQRKRKVVVNMTGMNGLKEYLKQKYSKAYLIISAIVTAFMLGSSVVILVLIYAGAEKTVSQKIMLGMPSVVVMASCFLLMVNTIQLLKHTAGKEINWRKTIATIHLSVGLQLICAPFLCMALCDVTAFNDAAAGQSLPYQYIWFRAAWEVLGLTLMTGIAMKLASLHMVEKQMANQKSAAWPFLASALLYLLQAAVIVFITLYFRPTQSVGWLVRGMMYPVVLFDILSAVFNIRYFLFLKRHKNSGLEEQEQEVIQSASQEEVR